MCKNYTLIFEDQVSTTNNVYVENKGSIFISKNPTFKRTNNIDTRYNFIPQYIKDGVIEIEFIQKENNKLEIMINNFSKDKNQIKLNDIVNQVNKEQG